MRFFYAAIQSFSAGANTLQSKNQYFMLKYILLVIEKN